MSITEQMAGDRAFAIYQDLVFGIRPASRPMSIRWLALARKWAQRRGLIRLTCEIDGYLAALECLPAGETFACPAFLAA